MNSYTAIQPLEFIPFWEDSRCKTSHFWAQMVCVCRLQIYTSKTMNFLRSVKATWGSSWIHTVGLSMWPNDVTLHRSSQNVCFLRMSLVLAIWNSSWQINRKTVGRQNGEIELTHKRRHVKNGNWFLPFKPSMIEIYESTQVCNNIVSKVNNIQPEKTIFNLLKWVVLNRYPFSSCDTLARI